MPSININSIAPGSKVWVTGNVDYCRIASLIDGDELAADDARRSARGLIPTGKPHTRLSLRNCVVVYENPSAPTLAEQYIASKLYTSKAHPEHSPCYSATNKSRNLPSLFCRENAGVKSLEAVTPEGELAAGTPVTILIRFFAAKNNHGCSLDTVIVNEKPISYFGKNTAESVLKDYGFEIVNTDASVDELRSQIDEAPDDEPVASAVPTPQAAPYVAPPQQTAVPPVAPEQPVTSTAAPYQVNGVNLPTPPAGYMYDGESRLVPISNGGIKL